MNEFFDWLDELTWWRRKPLILYRNIKYFMSNLVYYSPMLWSDRNWDESYIFKALLYKLKRQENIIRNNGHLMISTRSANEILFCINLIESRILNQDNYLDLCGYDKVSKKWGELKLFSMSDNNSGLCRLRRKFVKTKEDKIQAQKETGKVMDNMEYLINQDIEYLFNYMRKHIRNWWD